MTAAAREFGAMRLFVPAGQARARGFYIREGFSVVGEPFDSGLGLPLLEYRRSLRLYLPTQSRHIVRAKSGHFVRQSAIL